MCQPSPGQMANQSGPSCSTSAKSRDWAVRKARKSIVNEYGSGPEDVRSLATPSQLERVDMMGHLSTLSPSKTANYCVNNCGKQRAPRAFSASLMACLAGIKRLFLGDLFVAERRGGFLGQAEKSEVRRVSHATPGTMHKAPF